MTPALAAAGIYCGLAALFHIALQWLVIRERMATRTSLGDGGHKSLIKVIRAHGNYAENAPFIVAVLIALALTAFPALFIHGLGVVFVVARLAHAYTLAFEGGPTTARTIGVMGTQFVYGVGGAALVLRGLGLI